ncbi:hypothetical protein [Streptacidiphilus fuscans]|uniref:Uncharacterized protein n=1 Tax=Streptacidiphilus fuscans TaxID=2789292 RepID=A0A931B152_9ACTN|nr:hypothetical protein [Streptacidiphilus fuscans]MBF9069250.1 hypothetical protein [Streptacidiphilus fuscans]
MRRSATVIAGALAAFTALVGLAAGPAQAATGQVVVFSTELQPLDIYQNPTGCQKLPPLSHVVDNLTDSTIRVYADPFCTIPASLPGSGGGVGTLAAGYGTHVSGVGSFSA